MSPEFENLKAALSDSYDVEQELGAGGMATVYRVRDLKHDRRVALKVLKPELAAVIGADRFVTEIKTTAQLQHPHILPLFDSGEADGFLYYVMPFIEGESLREKLNRDKQLGLKESVRIAREVADALEYAHRQDVIHRDIKPENILLHDGRPVVADFGIALAISAAGGGRMTETGLSLGTPHYMSPEQATADRDLTVRSDIYSLGCVLYEMLTGDPPHTGPTSQSILMRILTETPRSVTDVRASVPPHVASAVAKAIEKLPADRFRSAGALMEALEDESFRHTVRAPAATAAPEPVVAEAPPVAAAAETGGPGRLLPAALAVLTLAFASIAAWSWLRSEETPRQVQRTDLHLGNIYLPYNQHVEISPDGSTFALAGRGPNGVDMVHVRRADEPSFRPIPGTEGARDPAFSPDGQWVVYRDHPGDALMKVTLAGGAPLTVVADGAVSPYMPHWGDDGTIVFTGPQGPHRVPETGGTPAELSADGGTPRLLPGGRGVLLSIGQSIGLLDLSTDSTRTLIAEGHDATYLPTGHILFLHPQGGLQAVGFDLEALQVTSQPVPVVDGVGRAFRGAFYAVSSEGTLAYVTGRASAVGSAGARSLLTANLETGAVDPAPLEPRLWDGVRYSPDGRYVAYSSGASNEQQIFVYDLELGTTPRQLTFEGNNEDVVWSPDGTRVAFNSDREGTEGEDLFIKSVVDDSPATSVLTRPGNQWPTDWPSEEQLLFGDFQNRTSDLWMVNPSGASDPEPYLESEAFLRSGVVSPDGQLAVYDSNEDGQRGIYVRSFPQPRQQSRVSAGPGRTPRWSPDGDAIYYWNLSGDDTVFVARIQTEPAFAVLSVETALAGDYGRNVLDVHPDGNQLLVISGAGSALTPGNTSSESEEERYIVVFNWFEELKARLGESD